MKEIESLIERARLADIDIAEKHRAFSEIVERFQDMAHGCAYAVLGDFQLAEDAVQEAFITAYQNLDKLRTPQAFPGWLRRIVLTQCNRLTRRKTLPTEPIEAANNIASTERDADEAVVAEEASEQILTAIRRLPENQRWATQLFYIDGYSRKEIAEFLKVPVTTVNNWLYASRKWLKDTLSPDLIGERMFEMVRDKLQERRLANAERLFNAIEVGEIDSVKELLKFDPTLTYVKYNRGTHWKEEAIIDETPLHAAADYGEKELVNLLLANGAQINAKRSDGNTPLHLAANVGSLTVVECLIRNGADVRVRNNWEGTPLHLAAQHENTDIATILLQNGADVHAGWHRPLHTAAWHGHRAMAELMLRHGADVNATDPPLLTPLHSAVRNNQREMVEFLLDHGAEVNAESDVRRRPLHLAARPPYQRGVGGLWQHRDNRAAPPTRCRD
jgi:RNA polymerase sigma factor (sigma-70 family)